MISFIVVRSLRFKNKGARPFQTDLSAFIAAGSIRTTVHHPFPLRKRKQRIPYNCVAWYVDTLQRLAQENFASSQQFQLFTFA
jgi:hypothetical protein